MKKEMKHMSLKNLMAMAVAAILVAACGAKAPVAVPVGPGGYAIGAGCGSVNTGNNQIYGYGTLQSYYGGLNSISVSVQALNLSTQGDPQNVLGSGCMNLTDLPGLMTQINGGQVTVPQTSIALSSSGPNSSAAAPGMFWFSTAALSITLTGSFPYQITSPFNGYPTGYPNTGLQTQTGLITVQIGPMNGGGPSAGLSNNRLQGQLLVNIGPATFPYTSN